MIARAIPLNTDSITFANCAARWQRNELHLWALAFYVVDLVDALVEGSGKRALTQHPMSK